VLRTVSELNMGTGARKGAGTRSPFIARQDFTSRPPRGCIYMHTKELDPPRYQTGQLSSLPADVRNQTESRLYDLRTGNRTGLKKIALQRPRTCRGRGAYICRLNKFAASSATERSMRLVFVRLRAVVSLNSSPAKTTLHRPNTQRPCLVSKHISASIPKSDRLTTTT